MYLNFEAFAGSKNDKSAKIKAKAKIEKARIAAQAQKDLAKQNRIMAQTLQRNQTLRNAMNEQNLTERTNIGEQALTQRTGIAADAVVNTADIKTSGKVDIADITTSGKVDLADIQANRDVAITGDKAQLAQIAADRELTLREMEAQLENLKYQYQLESLQVRNQIEQDALNAALERRMQEVEIKRAEAEAMAPLDYDTNLMLASESNNFPTEDVDFNSNQFESFSDEPSAFDAFAESFMPTHAIRRDAARGNPEPRPIGQSGINVDPRYAVMADRRISRCASGANPHKCGLQAAGGVHHTDSGSFSFAASPDGATDLQMHIARNGAIQANRLRQLGITPRTKLTNAPIKQIQHDQGKPCCGGCASGNGCSGGCVGCPLPRPDKVKGCLIMGPSCGTDSLGFSAWTGEEHLTGPCGSSRGCEPRAFSGSRLKTSSLPRLYAATGYSIKGGCDNLGCTSDLGRRSRSIGCGNKAKSALKKAINPTPVYRYKVLRRVDPFLM